MNSPAFVRKSAKLNVERNESVCVLTGAYFFFYWFCLFVEWNSKICDVRVCVIKTCRNRDYVGNVMVYCLFTGGVRGPEISGRVGSENFEILKKVGIPEKAGIPEISLLKEKFIYY